MCARRELQRCAMCASLVSANLEDYWRSWIAAGMIRAAHFGPEGNGG